MFSKLDSKLMGIALEKAQDALEKGNYPVGAILVVDDEVFDLSQNSNQIENSWIKHAEFKLILNNSDKIKNKLIKSSRKVELF